MIMILRKSLLDHDFHDHDHDHHTLFQFQRCQCYLKSQKHFNCEGEGNWFSGSHWEGHPLSKAAACKFELFSLSVMLTIKGWTPEPPAASLVLEWNRCSWCVFNYSTTGWCILHGCVLVLRTYQRYTSPLNFLLGSITEFSQPHWSWETDVLIPTLSSTTTHLRGALFLLRNLTNSRNPSTLFWPWPMPLVQTLN